MALFIEEKTHNSKEAPKNDKILLVDSDTVCFHSILQCTSEEILMDRSFYSDEAWAILEKEEGFNEHTNTCRHLDFEQAKKAFDYKIESLLMATGCKEAKLYVTSWFPTFRHTFLPEYKSDRKGSLRPLRLQEFKLWLVQERNAVLEIQSEADELVVSEYLENPNTTIIASVDKDLLSQVPGPKFDYYSTRFHNINVSQGTATYNFHLRLLTGDRGDYILTGLNRVGEKTAIKILASAKTKFDTMMRLKDGEPSSEELEEYKLNLYTLVRREYVRQGISRLHLMWATIGADYLRKGKIVVPSPPNILGVCCYCKNKTEEIECGEHKLPDYSDIFSPLDKVEDTHLLQGITQKKQILFSLYKEYIEKYEDIEIEFFYLFVSGVFRDIKSIDVEDIVKKLKG